MKPKLISENYCNQADELLEVIFFFKWESYLLCWISVENICVNTEQLSSKDKSHGRTQNGHGVENA